MTNHEVKKQRPIYIVSSVRGISPNEREAIQAHVNKLKKSGENLVFDPYQDAPQDDSTGLNIILAELDFLAKIAESNQRGEKYQGKVEFFWNPKSEGSRVDFGMAVALNLQLKLIKSFESKNQEIPQVTIQLIQEICQLQENNQWPPPKNQEISPHLSKLLSTLENIQGSQVISVDWNVEMDSIQAEWQRITLGLALGSMIGNPNLNIKLGNVTGTINPNQKSYPRAIQELESAQTTT